MGGVELGGVSTEAVIHGELLGGVVIHEQTVLLGGVFEDGEFKDKIQVSDETECTSGDESGATLVGDVGYGEDEFEADEVENCEVPYSVEGFIFCFEMASGSKGQIPHFAKPDLMLGIENDFSKGDFNTLENSVFVTTKFFLENDKARTAFEKLSFSDLKTATSRDWRV